MVTATLQPHTEAAVPHIPLHTLQGDARFWADRLLSLFQGKTLDGVEWSMKFSSAGLVGNRYMLGLSRDNWRQLDWSTLSRALQVPPELWGRILADMEHARAAYFAYEPDERGVGSYRIYLEFMPTPEALQREGVLPLGCGYKWCPALELAPIITAYRMRHLPDREAFDGYLAPYLARLTQPVLRQTAEKLIDLAVAQGRAQDFMFLEVDEAASRRDSFTVTFRGTDLPLRAVIPDLLRLAGSLALAESEVLGYLVPDEPRSLYSLAGGTARDGHEFLTVYYD